MIERLRGILLAKQAPEVIVDVVVLATKFASR